MCVDFCGLDSLKSGVICTKTLTPKEADQFRHAIENQYWYQLFLDDLPIWGRCFFFVVLSSAAFAVCLSVYMCVKVCVKVFVCVNVRFWSV
jgi:Endomembrane protein 70